jgi:hypothetical protein
MCEVIELNLHKQTEKAFSERSIPTTLVEIKTPVSPEQKDALWFRGQDWKAITWEDWDGHPDAIYTFTPEAFAYYLPSIICLSIQFPDKWFFPVDSLLRVLDRSPVVEYWDSFIVTRLIGLKQEEYQVLKEWILWLSENTPAGLEVDFDRAFDTVDLLENETNRVRKFSRPIN